MSWRAVRQSPEVALVKSSDGIVARERVHKSKNTQYVRLSSKALVWLLACMAKFRIACTGPDGLPTSQMSPINIVAALRSAMQRIIHRALNLNVVHEMLYQKMWVAMSPM